MDNQKKIFEDKGLTAVSVNNVSETIKAINDHSPFDVMIVDCRLDETDYQNIDGVEIAKLIKKIDPRIPVIGTSAYIDHKKFQDEFTKFIGKSVEPNSATDIINEISEMGMKHYSKLVNEHDSVFISYGGPDEEYADKINNFLQENGVKTWFFPKDALPGQKLHRVMFEGVNLHDRVLLICSKSSLNRNGVLNEIERVLEREAKEGGSAILIPITIDDFVFDKWNPDRSDIAKQIKTRVITSFPDEVTSDKEFKVSAEKLIKALKKST